jgi:hypothetical protein
MADTHLFPWWGGYFLISPLRRLVTDPGEMLRDLVRPGMTVLFRKRNGKPGD